MWKNVVYCKFDRRANVSLRQHTSLVLAPSSSRQVWFAECFVGAILISTLPLWPMGNSYWTVILLTSLVVHTRHYGRLMFHIQYGHVLPYYVISRPKGTKLVALHLFVLVKIGICILNEVIKNRSKVSPKIPKIFLMTAYHGHSHV